jgi:hypothetical protein
MVLFAHRREGAELDLLSCGVAVSLCALCVRKGQSTGKILILIYVFFRVFKIGKAYLKDVREQSKKDAEKQAKKLQKKSEKSSEKGRVPIAPLKRSPNAPRK